MLSKREKINIWNKPSMKLFTMLSGYFILLLTLYTIFQLLKIDNVLGLVQIISILLPIIFYLYNLEKKKSKETVSVLGCYLLLLVILPFIWGNTYDLTVDGNSYHKTAIAFIKNGWNPIYESSTEFQVNNSMVVEIGEDSNVDLWIEHYPKGTWIISAVIYNMTGNIESGKCITIIFIVMLFIITFNCLRTILDKKWTFILTTLLCLNPITLAQLFSYYVDSLMGICFVIQLLLLFMIKPMEKQNKIIWLCLLSLCTFFTNIKFTGLLCSGVIAAVFYFYWLIKYRKEEKFLIKIRNITFHFIVVFATAIFFVGCNSYVKNTIDHMNPLYPLFGEDKVDIITTMQPKVFGELSMIEKFTWSLFSKTENLSYNSGNPKVKLPFRLYSSEVKELLAPDVRIAGFGPLFTLAFIISIVVFILSLVLFIKNEKKNLKYIVLTGVAIIVTMILVGENWWARYVPQMYIFPIGTIVLTLYTKKYYKKEILPKIMSIVLAVALLLNAGTFSYAIYNSIKSFITIENDLKVLTEVENLELKLGGAPDLYGYYYNLKDKNIKYTVVEEIPESQRRYMYCWRLEVKMNEELSKTN